MNKLDSKLRELIITFRKLRDPVSGCPWDKEQDFKSIASCAIEESYEVADAIEREDFEDLKAELGDLLFQIVFHSEMAKEKDLFTIEDVIDELNSKLIRRHPHVFDRKKLVKDKIKPSWELQKHKEKKRNSRLDGVPKSLPGLIQAQRIQEKASYVGFDFEKEEDIWDKLSEEITELKNAQKKNNKDEVQEEIGDIIFTLINLARFLGISADDALRKSNNKFISRFKMVENELKIKGKNIEESSINEMDEIWDEIKTNSN